MQLEMTYPCLVSHIPLIQAVNEIEALKHSAEDLARLGSEGGVEEIRKDLKTIHRTTTRISLTCRSVLKVHNKLFKF